MWPTDEIGTLQTKDNPELLEAAKRTVYGLNDYAGYTFAGSKTPWANTNGVGLSWPPAVRVSNQSDTMELVRRFAVAAAKMTAPNGIIHNGGGMLENAGGAQAINDMLFQSHAGALRFLPVWDAKAAGPASFRTLRGYGAFLASAAVDSSGKVGPIELVSEQGSDCVVESPWSTLVVKENGKTVATSKTGDNMYSFKTTAGATYILSAQ